jgi:t-SNARE complex subunit (syntaxin)
VQVSVVGGVVVVVVSDVVDAGADVAAGVDGAVHTDVAVASAALAAAESASSCFWSATNLACSWATD